MNPINNQERVNPIRFNRLKLISDDASNPSIKYRYHKIGHGPTRLWISSSVCEVISDAISPFMGADSYNVHKWI